jgi:hypothetical protein
MVQHGYMISGRCARSAAVLGWRVDLTQCGTSVGDGLFARVLHNTVLD